MAHNFLVALARLSAEPYTRGPRGADRSDGRRVDLGLWLGGGACSHARPAPRLPPVRPGGPTGTVRGLGRPSRNRGYPFPGVSMEVSRRPQEMGSLPGGSWELSWNRLEVSR